MRTFKPAAGIYFVLGYGTNKFGHSYFYCAPFVEEREAEIDLAQRLRMDDGRAYTITTDMTRVSMYCDRYDKEIPLYYHDNDWDEYPDDEPQEERLTDED